MLNDATAYVSSINTTLLELLLNQDRPTTIFLLVFSKSSDSQWQQHGNTCSDLSHGTWVNP